MASRTTGLKTVSGDVERRGEVVKVTPSSKSIGLSASIHDEFIPSSFDLPLTVSGRSEDVNCNHPNNPHKSNVNPEPRPNEGCGCTFSYNGGAGGGTADCCNPAKAPVGRDTLGFGPDSSGCTSCGANGKCQCAKQTSGSCQEDLYQKELCNKKPDPCWPDGFNPAHYNQVPKKNESLCRDSYDSRQQNAKVINQNPAVGPARTYNFHHDHSCTCNACCDSPYEKELASKKPDACCPCTSEPDTYCSVKNTDAQRYKGTGPDRSAFYADDETCGCAGAVASKRCSNCSRNNNFDLEMRETCVSPAYLSRKSYTSDYFTTSSSSPRVFNLKQQLGSDMMWMESLADSSLDFHMAQKSRRLVEDLYMSDAPPTPHTLMALDSILSVEPQSVEPKPSLKEEEHPQLMDPQAKKIPGEAGHRCTIS